MSGIGEDYTPTAGFTMIGQVGLINLRYCLETVIKENIPGDFLEAGVWRGGASIFARAILDRYRQDHRAVWV